MRHEHRRVIYAATKAEHGGVVASKFKPDEKLDSAGPLMNEWWAIYRRLKRYQLGSAPSRGF
jgi:hypothetical protein